MQAQANMEESSYVDAADYLSSIDYFSNTSVWPGFEIDGFEVTPSASLLASSDDDREGPLLDALSRLQREQLRNERLLISVDVARALGGLSHSGKPDICAAQVQRSFRGHRARQLHRHAAARWIQAHARRLTARLIVHVQAVVQLQRAVRSFLSRMRMLTKTQLLRSAMRLRTEHTAALMKKDAAIEQLIEAHIGARHERQVKCRTQDAVASTTPPCLLRPPVPSAGVAAGAAVVPVPFAMERDAAALLMDAEVLITRLEVEKADLAIQLHESLEHTRELAELASQLALSKEAAEEEASLMLVQQLSMEHDKTRRDHKW